MFARRSACLAALACRFASRAALDMFARRSACLAASACRFASRAALGMFASLGGWPLGLTQVSLKAPMEMDGSEKG